MSALKTQIADSKEPMSAEERKQWLEATTTSLALSWQIKYRNGTIEHKQDLGELTIGQLLNEIENEALDQLSFVRELKRRLKIE